MTAPVDFATLEAEILARAPEHTPHPSLDRVRWVCEYLGDPQAAYPVVHLTGTNGKTSTARMVDRLLREHGLRTGRFTSPHLAHVGERIVVDGVRLREDRFVAAWHDIAPYVALADERSGDAGGPRLSFFEVLTCLAFAVFADAPVDVAVLEVGLGGLWDSTNVADGAVAVVTGVDLDHERWLGRTLAEIAEQKAGIVKPGAVAVLARQSPAAAEILRRRCEAVGAEVRVEGEHFGVVERLLAVGGQRLELRTGHGSVDDVYLPLHGAHQAVNAACALAAAEAFLVGDRGGALAPDVVRDAFAHVDSPGRLEVVGRRPLAVVDAAHNPAGSRAVAAALPEAFPGARFIAVLGVMADKDAVGIAAGLGTAVDTVIVTESASARALPTDDLADAVEQARPGGRVVVEPDLEAALHTARALAVDVDEAAAVDAARTGAVLGGVIVAGSIYLAAEARRLLGAADPDTVAVDTTRRALGGEDVGDDDGEDDSGEYGGGEYGGEYGGGHGDGGQYGDGDGADRP
ncbi:MAG: bifunctional folylpolyglutamate synthase/dihydrofolate synthase [Actinomycetales bacterium]